MHETCQMSYRARSLSDIKEKYTIFYNRNVTKMHWIYSRRNIILYITITHLDSCLFIRSICVFI